MYRKHGRGVTICSRLHKFVNHHAFPNHCKNIECFISQFSFQWEQLHFFVQPNKKKKVKLGFNLIDSSNPTLQKCKIISCFCQYGMRWRNYNMGTAETGYFTFLQFLH